MTTLDEKELQYYIDSRIKNELRIKKYIAVLVLGSASAYALYYLGATIWHILIMVATVEIAFIIADIQPKKNEAQEEYYEKQFFKRKKFIQRKKERRKERLNKEKDIISKKSGENMAQVPADVGCNNEECMAKDECNRFKIAKENSAREVQTFNGSEVKKCGKFIQA